MTGDIIPSTKFSVQAQEELLILLIYSFITKTIYQQYLLINKIDRALIGQLTPGKICRALIGQLTALQILFLKKYF